MPGDVLLQSSVDMDRSHRVDIRGWRLLADIEFWQLFAIMCILAGIGLMTIKYVEMFWRIESSVLTVISNIGHDVNALWKSYNSSVTEKYLIAQQQIHVSLLSFGSFGGRLLSGNYSQSGTRNKTRN
jgi:hypothetical protein